MHIDVGIDIMSTDKDKGIIQSFKTRDMEPFRIGFTKKYDRMLIEPFSGEMMVWEDL